MSSPQAGHGERLAGFEGVRAPKPLLSAENERRLTARQRELLDDLGTADGLGELTMSEIAARMNCSLRTLYGIAPSKEELVLTVVDRRLHRIGRSAVGSFDDSLSALGKLRAYLRAANRAVALRAQRGHLPANIAGRNGFRQSQTRLATRLVCVLDHDGRYWIFKVGRIAEDKP